MKKAKRKSEAAIDLVAGCLFDLTVGAFLSIGTAFLVFYLGTLSLGVEMREVPGAYIVPIVGVLFCLALYGYSKLLQRFWDWVGRPKAERNEKRGLE